MSVTEARADKSSEKLGFGYFDGLKPGDIREITSDKLFFGSKGDRVTHDTAKVLDEMSIDESSWCVGAVPLEDGRYLVARGIEVEDSSGSKCYLVHEQELNRHNRALSERLYAVGLKDQTA